jgi:CubicO group peptidase (beta-lactamase class C family)
MEGLVRKHLSAAFLACLILVPARADELPRALPADVGLSPEKLEKVKAAVQTAVDQKQTAGVIVAIARRGKLALLETFGKSDIAADKPMRPDAIFRIYSMTKPIVTVAAMQLVEEGKIKLDDPVSKYVPEFKDLRVHAGTGDATVAAKREVTIRDLMRHTSGLTYGAFDTTPVDLLYRQANVLDRGDTLTAFVGKLGKLPLLYQPGTHFQYSVSTDVLGHLIEVVSGQPLDDCLQARVFRPLDMRDTGFFVPADKLDRLAVNFGPDDKGGLKVIDAPLTSPYRARPKFLSGGGGLVSTSRDYLRFCQMMLSEGELEGKRLLQAETVRQMTVNQLPAEALPMKLGALPLDGMGFGLGFSVRMAPTATVPAKSLGEFGWGGAASTHFWICPKQELVVVILQQYMPMTPRLEVALKPLIYEAIVD